MAGAKIFGQLEKAQYENIVGNPSTALAVGRMWVDITTPSAGIPKMYDGTTSRSLLMAPITGSTPGTGAVTSYNAIGNSGSALTVNWANGPTQSLTLTANCLVSFSNPPAAGQVCTLIVTQASSYPGFAVRFQADTYWQRLQAIPDMIPLNGVRVFKFMSVPAYIPAVGTFGVQFGYVANNSTYGTPTQGQLAFSPDGRFLAVGPQSVGTVFMYKVGRDNSGVLSLALVSSIGTVGASGPFCIAWHPNGQYLLWGCVNGNLSICPVTDGGIFGTINATIALGFVPQGLAVSPQGDAVLITSTSSPYIIGYPITTSGIFGSAYSNPSTIPTGAAYSVRFNPSGSFFALGMNVAPGLAVYAFNSSTGFGAASTAPTPLSYIASAKPSSVDWSKDGNFVAMGITASPFIVVWPVNSSGVIGTVVANPSVLPSAACSSVAFSAQSDFIATTQAVGVGAYIYNFSIAGAGAFGTLINTSTSVGTGQFDVQISPDNEVAAYYGGSTQVIVALQMPRSVKNSIMKVDR